MTHSTQDLCKKSIAVFRSLPGLGDFLCVIPTLRALRAAFPTAQIVWIGLPNVAEWVTRFHHYIDEFVEFPGYPGLPEQSPKLDRLPDFLNELRQRNFDLAIQMHGSGVITNQITISLGAQKTAGFFHPDYECPDIHSYLPFDESEPEIRRYLRLMEFLGISADDEALEFPIGQKDGCDLYLILFNILRRQWKSRIDSVCSRIDPNALRSKLTLSNSESRQLPFPSNASRNNINVA